MMHLAAATGEGILGAVLGGHGHSGRITQRSWGKSISIIGSNLTLDRSQGRCELRKEGSNAVYTRASLRFLDRGLEIMYRRFIIEFIVAVSVLPHVVDLRGGSHDLRAVLCATCRLPRIPRFDQTHGHTHLLLHLE